MTDRHLGVSLLAALLASLALAALLLVVRWPEIKSALQGVAP